MKKTTGIVILIVLVVAAVAGIKYYYGDTISSLSEKLKANEKVEIVDTVKTKPEVFADTLTTTLKSQKQVIELPMTTSEDGSFITVKVNGIPMKFLVDTGCNTMSIGYIEYMFLKNQSLINAPLGETKDVSLADGSVKKFASVILDSISVGPATLKNVGCVVAMPDSTGVIPESTSLIGFSTFFKFSRTITFNPDYNKFVIELK